MDSTIGGRPPPTWEVEIPPLGGSPSWARFPSLMEGFWFGSYSKTCSPTLGASTYIMRGIGEGADHHKPMAWPHHPCPLEAGAHGTPSPQTLAPLLHYFSRICLAKLRRRSPSTPPPRRRAAGIPRRIYYFRCPLERGEGRRHQHRTCDRVRRCCPIVAP